MKKIRVLSLIAIIMVISLIGATGVWAGTGVGTVDNPDIATLEHTSVGAFPLGETPPWSYLTYLPYPVLGATPGPKMGLWTYYAGWLQLDCGDTIGATCSVLVCVPTPPGYPELSRLTILYWAVPGDSDDGGPWVGRGTSTAYDEDRSAYRCATVESPAIVSLQGEPWGGIFQRIDDGLWPYGVNTGEFQYP